MMLLRATLALALALPAVPAFAAGPGGTYRGTYTCLPGQGVTGDTSTLFVDRRNRAKLFQVVYPVPGGQVFPNGVFEYAGTYDPASRIYNFTSGTIVGENHFWALPPFPQRYAVSEDGVTVQRYMQIPACSAEPYTRVRATTPPALPVGGALPRGKAKGHG